MAQLPIIQNLATRSAKSIVLINPRYPFGKDQVFLPGSLISVAARLQAMGRRVRVFDLNIDRLADTEVKQVLSEADLIGISLTGAAHIPACRELIIEVRTHTVATVMLGGQIIERLTEDEFQIVFGGDSTIIQIRDEKRLASALGCAEADIPPPESVAYTTIWEQIGEERLTMYLQQEVTLVVSQGCHFRCAFCAASKARSEQFRSLEVFTADLRYLAKVATRHGQTTLEFYASSLDFFQNPTTVRAYLEALAAVQEETGVRFRVRCLSCLTSFINAAEKIADFPDLLHRSGLWCVGFGSDGTDEQVWKAEAKRHNTLAKMVECLELCHEFGVRAELLMVLGFPEENCNMLGKTLLTSLWVVCMWPDVIIRPYLAKFFIPGNKGWQTAKESVRQTCAHPQKFYNLDFCAIGSSLTHPRRLHRWQCNAAYLAICAGLTPFGKCTTSPLLPQGEDGFYGRVAKVINRLMPFDR